MKRIIGLFKKEILPYFMRYRIFVLIAFVLLFFHGMFLRIGTSDLRTFMTLGFYLLLAYLYKLRSKTTFLIPIFLLIVLYIEFLRNGVSLMSEKTAVWLVLFLIVGIVQQWNE